MLTLFHDRCTLLINVSIKSFLVFRPKSTFVTFHIIDVGLLVGCHCIFVITDVITNITFMSTQGSIVVSCKVSNNHEWLLVKSFIAAKNAHETSTISHLNGILWIGSKIYIISIAAKSFKSWENWQLSCWCQNRGSQRWKWDSNTNIAWFVSSSCYFLTTFLLCNQ